MPEKIINQRVESTKISEKQNGSCQSLITKLYGAKKSGTNYLIMYYVLCFSSEEWNFDR